MAEEQSWLVSLGKAWFDLPGLAGRGAGARLVLATNVVARVDLETNYDVIAQCITCLGYRPAVDSIADEVMRFFNLARPRGKPAVPCACAGLGESLHVHICLCMYVFAISMCIA